MAAVGEGLVLATTTPEAIQEFVHVRARWRSREDAVSLGRRYATALAPLLRVDEEALHRGLELFEAHSELDAFDAVLAAAALFVEAAALVSADRAFGVVEDLRYVDPASPAIEESLGFGD